MDDVDRDGPRPAPPRGLLLGPEVQRLALGRGRAAIDASDDPVLLAAEPGAAVDVRVGTECLDDVHLDR